MEVKKKQDFDELICPIYSRLVRNGSTSASMLLGAFVAREQISVKEFSDIITNCQGRELWRKIISIMLKQTADERKVSIQLMSLVGVNDYLLHQLMPAEMTQFAYETANKYSEKIEKRFNLLQDSIQIQNSSLLERLVGHGLMTNSDINDMRQRQPTERAQSGFILNLAKDVWNDYQVDILIQALLETDQKESAKTILTCIS